MLFLFLFYLLDRVLEPTTLKHTDDHSDQVIGLFGKNLTSCEFQNNWLKIIIVDTFRDAWVKKEEEEEEEDG